MHRLSRHTHAFGGSERRRREVQGRRERNPSRLVVIGDGQDRDGGKRRGRRGSSNSSWKREAQHFGRRGAGRDVCSQPAFKSGSGPDMAELLQRGIDQTGGVVQGEGGSGLHREIPSLTSRVESSRRARKIRERIDDSVAPRMAAIWAVLSSSMALRSNASRSFAGSMSIN